MPGDHRFRLDDGKGRAPTRPKVHKPRPEEPVRCHEVNTPTLRPPQHINLVAQSEDLQLQSGPRPEGGAEGGKGGNQQTEHRDESLPAEPRQHQLIQRGGGF